MIINEDVFLEHYGKKGMKWGQRRAQNKLARKDKKWEKKINSASTQVKLYNEAADIANKNLPALNKKWANVDLRKPGPKQTAYYKEVQDDFNRSYAKALNNLGSSPSGKKVYAKINNKTGIMSVEVR